MFSKAVYSKLEFLAPMSRKKMPNLSFFFQNGFFSCACVSCDAKKTVSALSGVNQGHF